MAQFPANFNPAYSRQSNVEKDGVVSYVATKLQRFFTGVRDVYGIRIFPERPRNDAGISSNSCSMRGNVHSITGPVAQLVEQGTFNPKVAGSIPARPIRERPAKRDLVILWLLDGRRTGQGDNESDNTSRRS